MSSSGAGSDPPEVAPRSFLVHVALLLGLAVAAAVLLGLGLWAGLGRPDLGAPAPAPSGSAPAPRPLTVGERLEGLKIVLAVVAGIGGVVALTVAYRRQRHGEMATYREKRAEEREVTKAFTDRYATAAGMLGGETAAVRLAGVYALAALADDWPDGRQTCIDLLCAYLRMPYETDPSAPAFLPGNREVRRTLLRIIRNHLRPGWTEVSWASNKFSFEGAVFDCGDLSGIRLDGDPDAPQDRRPNMTFYGARFVGGTFEMQGVEFAGTPVWFGEAEFAGGRVTFRGSRFSGSRVYFDRCRFTGADVSFTGAEWTAGKVTFDGASVTGGTVDPGPFAAELPRHTGPL